MPSKDRHSLGDRPTRLTARRSKKKKRGNGFSPLGERSFMSSKPGPDDLRAKAIQQAKERRQRAMGARIASEETINRLTEALWANTNTLREVNGLPPLSPSGEKEAAEGADEAEEEPDADAGEEEDEGEEEEDD